MHARAHTEVYAEQPMLRASAPRRLRAASLRRCFSTRNGLANLNIAIAGASGGKPWVKPWANIWDYLRDYLGDYLVLLSDFLPVPLSPPPKTLSLVEQADWVNHDCSSPA